MKNLLITIALGLAFAGSSPALAQVESRAAAVSTAGLDLATAKDQRTLSLRVLHAASELCGTPSSADARGRARFETCRAEARAQAADQLRLLAERAGALKVAAR